MQIKARSLGIAAATTFISGYTIFAFMLKFFPNQTLKFIGLVHMMPKLEYIKPFIDVTLKSIILGIVTHTLIVFFFFWLIATIYNALQK